MLRLKCVLIFILFPSVLFTQTATAYFNNSTQPETLLYVWKYNYGDSLNWKQYNYKDDHWRVISWDSIPSVKGGMHWMRTKLFLVNEKEIPIFMRITISKMPYQVYVDGQLIHANGKVGNNKYDEVKGVISSACFLPTSLAKTGEHIIAIRLSNFNGPFSVTDIRIRVDSRIYEEVYRPEYYYRILIGLAVSFSVIILGFGLFYSGGRFKHYLYMSFMLIPYFILRLYEFMIMTMNLSMDFYYYYEEAYYPIFFSCQYFVLLFLVLNFNFQHKLKVLVFGLGIVIVSLLLGVSSYNFMAIFGIYMICLLTIFAIKQRKTGSILAATGILIYYIPRILNKGLLSYALFRDISYILWLFIIIILVSRQVHEQHEIQRSIELKAQRLETDLLKKSIQPHFLINTLASIKSLIKRKPVEAALLIQSLADEFRIIGKISAEKEIPILQEIELCRYHLKIMERRWDAKYELILDNICEKENIPPLIFHTLIENGFTHAFKPKESGKFWLNCHKENGFINFRLQNDGSLLRKIDSNKVDLVERMGYNYVKTRLEERYPNKWEMKYGMIDNKWEVLIQIKT